MFVLFDEPVAECWNDVEVEVVIDDVQSSEICVKTLADWINPYTYTFLAPGIDARGLNQPVCPGWKALARGRADHFVGVFFRL